jgi:uncharacterized protein YdeI (YjbR/CyaY-like superfamily)
MASRKTRKTPERPAAPSAGPRAARERSRPVDPTDPRAQVAPRSRGEWRRWLQHHHAESTGVWLVFRKASAGGPRLSYDEAVEEALCFGWIDTTVRSLDEERYLQRFTPRTRLGNWSQSNLDRFARMEAAGLMTDAGRAKLPPGTQAPPPRLDADAEVPAAMAAALAAEPAAAAFFATLAPGYRRDYLRYVTEAKREETRQRRLQLAIRRLLAGEKRVADVERKD